MGCNCMAALGFLLQGRSKRPFAWYTVLPNTQGRMRRWEHSWRRRGLGVVACDWRGHGRSEGRRGYTPSYQKQTMADLTLMLAKTRLMFPAIPLFFYGHSMGGGMVLNYLLREKSEVVGVICTSPLLRLFNDPTVWEQRIMRYLFRPFLPYLARTNYRPENEPTDVSECVLTRDLATELRIRRDPLRNRKMTYSLAIESIDAGRSILARGAEIGKPMLLMVGTEDRVVSADACRELAATIGEPLCTFRIWDGAYHELHQDIEGAEVIDVVTKWVANCLK